MNTELMFSKQSDEWATPQDLFDRLDAEFAFDIDVAASRENAKCLAYLTEADNALVQEWRLRLPSTSTAFCNPPYSMCREFMAKAVVESHKGITVVCLVPARTDTRWFHNTVWDRFRETFYKGVEVRFIKGRLKFGGATAGAPFPSVIIIFRPFGGTE